MNVQGSLSAGTLLRLQGTKQWIYYGSLQGSNLLQFQGSKCPGEQPDPDPGDQADSDSNVGVSQGAKSSIFKRASDISNEET